MAESETPWVFLRMAHLSRMFPRVVTPIYTKRKESSPALDIDPRIILLRLLYQCYLVQLRTISDTVVYNSVFFRRKVFL